MRLIDLNVAIRMDNNDKVLSFLKQYKGDILTLQEVMRGVEDTVFDQYDNSTIIKKALNEYPYSFFGALWVAPYHIKNGIKSKIFGGLTEQGNEVISKYPIIEGQNHFFHKSYATFVDVTNFRKIDHPRAVNHVLLQIGEDTLQILNIHGIWNEGKKGDERTIKQCAFIVEKALERDLPTIIVGDFNLHPFTESIKYIEENFTNLIKLYKVQTTRPVVRDGLDTGNSVDDYIFINDKIKVNHFEVLKTDISDHYPLILDFELL